MPSKLLLLRPKTHPRNLMHNWNDNVIIILARLTTLGEGKLSRQVLPLCFLSTHSLPSLLRLFVGQVSCANHARHFTLNIRWTKSLSITSHDRSIPSSLCSLSFRKQHRRRDTPAYVSVGVSPQVSIYLSLHIHGRRLHPGGASQKP